MDEKKIMAKNFIWNTIGTGFNSFNSLFFLIIVTRINGLEAAGIFSIAYATSTILYTLALYSGRLCQVTDIENKISDKDYVANRILTCMIMLIGAAAYLGIKQYTPFKTGVFVMLAIFKGLEAFADILYGIMQKNGVLYKAGQSLTVKGFVGVILFGIINYFTKDLVLACLSLVIINLGAFNIYIPANEFTNTKNSLFNIANTFSLTILLSLLINFLLTII